MPQDCQDLPEDEYDDDEDSDPGPSRAWLRFAKTLANALLAGPADTAQLRQRAERCLGRAPDWLTPLCLRLHYTLQGSPLSPAKTELHGNPGKLADWLLQQPELSAARKHQTAPRIRAWLAYTPPMQARPAALAALQLPQLASPGEIADWLGISPEALAAYANLQERHTPPHKPQLANYRYGWQPKANGEARLIEAPKTRLRALQRHILNGILDRVPPHAAAHGCVRRHSAQSHAQLHIGNPILIKLDCRDFFTSIRFGRIRALFSRLGYPEASAEMLAGLCTHRTPKAILRQRPLPAELSPESRQTEIRRQQQLERRHLPQGAPTSPALANLCAYRLDCRLDALAQSCGGQYSRYVDDLAFSLKNPDPARARRVLALINDILLEEGFTPNWRKARVVPASQSQQLCGLTINQRLNSARRDYEQLKAILHNCCQYGATSQNRAGHPDFRAHLLGRIGWHQQSNPARAQRLLASFAQINWEN